MKLKPLLLLFFLFVSAFVKTAQACTIFLANDGKNIWIGNNEDESANTRYRCWYFPGEKGIAGYMVWSEKHEGHDDEMWQYPQGGLNEYGLFMDYTAIDDIPVKSDPAKKDREQEVVNDILRSCKTVDEALQFISQYTLLKLSAAQLFIGDASGNYATVHGNYIVRKTDPNFTLTNYCIANGHQEACWRRETSTSQLSRISSFNRDNVGEILRQTAQKWPGDVVTNYSMAVNLQQREITLWLKGDFTTPVTISLANELKKGKQHKDITEYFPANIAPVLKKNYEENGIKSTIDLYNTLRKYSSNEYNFNNDDALSFATELISGGKAADAILFLQSLKPSNGTNPHINDWLGIAYHYNNDVLSANKYFNKTLAQQPDDYLANLYLKRNSSNVIFKIHEWAGAKNVKLIGDFTEWLKKPVEMHRKGDYWYTELNIPPGQHQYKFLVDDVFYIPDPLNLIYKWKGDNINSILLL